MSSDELKATGENMPCLRDLEYLEPLLEDLYIKRGIVIADIGKNTAEFHALMLESKRIDKDIEAIEDKISYIDEQYGDE